MTLYYAKFAFTDDKGNYVFQGQTFFCLFLDLPKCEYSNEMVLTNISLSDIWGEIKL